MTVLGQATRQLAAQGQDPLPRVVLVSVDPERDTPEAMARYIGYFGDGNLGLTGELEEIAKLTGSLGVFFQKAATEDGNYGVDHSTVVLVIDPQARLKALFSAPHRVETLVHDLPLIMDSE
jgi:protein SCO1/2